jgi:hypothetical protein
MHILYQIPIKVSTDIFIYFMLLRSNMFHVEHSQFCDSKTHAILKSENPQKFFSRKGYESAILACLGLLRSNSVAFTTLLVTPSTTQ